MDKKLEKLEQMQKDMQEQMQSQMEEQLAKIQRGMKEQIMESQREMTSQLSKLLLRANNEDLQYPSGFTLMHIPMKPEINLQKPSITIMAQQVQSNYPPIPDLDEVAEEEKVRMDSQKQLEERCRWLEEKFKVMESADHHQGIDAKDLSLIPDLVFPPKFKMPEFEKYNGTSCLEVHITMFCRRMTGYVNNDQLLIHCFQDSLVGAASKWYNQLSRAKINSWKNLAQAFMKQYNHVTDMTPDKITLQNIEKKSNESLRQYAQRWREVAIQVQPPLLEKETTILFINTLKAPFITHMLGSATKSFSDIVMTGEMIENAVRSGKIELGESAKKSVPRKRDNEVNNTSTFNKGQSKSFTVNQPKMVTTNQQSPESNARKNTERPQFTPIPMTYRELYQNLFNTHVVSLNYLEPLQPPYPKWYDTNAQYEYHAGITGHSIENYTAFKKVVERLIKVGIVRFDDLAMPNVAGNPLPNHTDQGVNGISEGKNKKIKCKVAKVKTPLRQVRREMVMRGLIALDLGRESKEEMNYCEFHNEVGHEIQKCVEFRALVQNMMNNKEIEFYEETKNPVEGDICASEGESTVQNQTVNYPVVIISRPKNNEARVQLPPRVIIQIPTVFPYKDSKRVQWNYNCNVTIPGKQSLVDTLKEDQDRGSYTRSGRRYNTTSEKAQPVKGKALVVEGLKEKATKSELPANELVNEEEAKEFLKFLKHSEYSMVEQLRKQPARISVLALLLSSEVYRSALIKVLNETYVANDIFVNKLDRLVSNISADNYIFFNEDEIPPDGMGSTKALHITTRYKGYTLPDVLIDNGSALNILPLTTLNRLPVGSSHMKECQNIVKAFDGTERNVMGRIEVPLQIGPNIYEVDFFVMDIKPSYNCLLGRPWIHSVGAVPSSLHQKLKLVSEGRLITINAEEDIIATVSNNASYLETDDEAIECSFRSLKFVNVTFIAEGSKILEKGAGKEARKKKNLINGGGNQVGTNDIPPYIKNICIRGNHSSRERHTNDESYRRKAGKLEHQRHMRRGDWRREFVGHLPLHAWMCSGQLTAEEIPVAFRMDSE
ncbi:uncharacterized protein LOC128285384 [Gossypium arboreum]|uniref:uncharacterized protein LOC128285384 n=1 Tax=Gossypium arboreum TaxID=29729 RepID=UPI0022F14938|nr:uncharacterized protein LOC128285384 [Gossypium arboreum]